jgi:hypothetical protein
MTDRLAEPFCRRFLAAAMEQRAVRGSCRLTSLRETATRGAVKKIFPLSAPNHQPPRVIESIKSEVRKYLKRERRKKLPEDVDFWDFDCRTGQDEASAAVTHVSELVTAVDNGAKADWAGIYIEILAKPGHRTRKPAPPAPVTPPDAEIVVDEDSAVADAADTPAEA